MNNSIVHIMYNIVTIIFSSLEEMDQKIFPQMKKNVFETHGSNFV